MNILSKIPVLLIFMFIQACDPVEIIQTLEFELDITVDSITFAVIGDYGNGSNDELLVSELVKSWSPDFIITTGDNNYPNGDDESFEDNIAYYYGDYIYNYDASVYDRCNGVAFQDKVNRFFPSPGNHDDHNFHGLKYYQYYFTLPGNELYYKFFWGDVAFFSLNSTDRDISEQNEWLEQEIQKSEKSYNIVYFHHSPYSTGPHGNEAKMQLDYQSLGVNAVLTGHDHIYSRIEKLDEPGLYYIINGLGGKSLYDCSANTLETEDFSVVCYDENFGAIRGKANSERLIMEFFSVDNNETPIDSLIINSK